MNSGQFCTKVLHHSNQSVMDRVATEIATAASHLTPMMYSNMSPDDLLQHMRVLPCASALVKLHKQPTQFRFLACSSNNGSKSVALWLTALFAAIHQYLVEGWQRLLKDLEVAWKHLPPWYATQSVHIVNIVKHFNKLCVTLLEFVRGGGWMGFDVERLYTNIPQDGADGLIPTLAKLLGEFVWDTHSVSRSSTRSRLLKVFKDPTYGAEWLSADTDLHDAHVEYGDYNTQRKHGMHNARWGVDAVKQDFFLFDWKTAVDAIKFLVKFSYVQFGDQVWHQQVGIPMGINPAVYMANYYLFYYEFQFLKQFKLLLTSHPPVHGGGVEASQLFESPTDTETLGTPVWVNQWPTSVHNAFKGNVAQYILDKFQLMGRFVDDVTCGPNQFLPYLLNRSHTILGGCIRGIYPDCLLLKRTEADMWSFPTLDIRIVSSTEQQADVHGHINTFVTSNTVLYDKRREDCYDGIPVVQYSHVSSSLSARTTSGMLMGQLHRYKALIMLRGHYVLECALLLHRLIARGHHHRILFARLKRHLRMFPDTFGDAHFMALFMDIKRKYHDDRLPALCTAGIGVAIDAYL